MDYTTASDETLIELIIRAEEAALAELYDRYGRLVFSVAINLVGNRATAEEITLDIFTRVWRKAKTYRPDRAKVSVWLTSMTRYRSIDILRRESVRAENYSISWAKVSSKPLSQTSNPESATHLTLQKEKVRAAMAKLPQAQKEALALAYFNGYTHSEIAQVLELPLGTVKTRIRLGMQKLRHMLQND